MRQILSRREVRADRWRYPGEDGDGPRVQTLAELQAAAVPAGPVGVRLAPVDEVEQLAPYLESLELVIVHFDSVGDGRGYSQAQLLRDRLGYRGELRAAGAVRRDQLFLLARCGFDSFEFAAGEDPRAALAQLDAYSVAYQRSSGTLVSPNLRA
ncbi:MAG TPA: DUF934 domain-containing protein [Steroidobacteraceae bacterium]|nr:DUF934 domain-containing protein [Steroidobacteraceae bacterium]